MNMNIEENNNLKDTLTCCSTEHSASVTKLPKKILTLKELIEIERNPRKNKKININLIGTKYDVIYEVARDYFTWNIISKQSELEDDWHIQWYDTYISTETLRSMLPYQRINHFPGSYNLGRKNLLAKNLEKMKKYLPNEYDFFPRTWLLPNQYEEMKAYVNEHDNDKNSKNKVVLIVKPEASCQGRGIFLTKKIEGVISPHEHYVAQEYVKEPYLIDDYKFDLRIYALVKSVNPLKIFVYREGLARFATSKYEKPKKKNMKNMFMHLTNYAVNKKNPDFQFNEEETSDSIGHKRSFSAILKYLEDHGEDPNKVFDEICHMITKTICSVQPHLAHIYRICQSRDENSEMCFELFGFDIMLDKMLKPYVLEVNHTPSFTTDSPLDLHIKRNLILDTLILMNITNKAKKKYLETKNMPNVLKVTAKIPPQELEELQKKIRKYEDKHMGGYVRVYPVDPGCTTKVNYQAITEVAANIWNETLNPKRIKQIDMLNSSQSNTINPVNSNNCKNGNGANGSNGANGNANSNNNMPKQILKKISIPKQRGELGQGNAVQGNIKTSSTKKSLMSDSKELVTTSHEIQIKKLDDITSFQSNSSLSLNLNPLKGVASSIGDGSTTIVSASEINTMNTLKNYQDIANSNLSFQTTVSVLVNSLSTTKSRSNSMNDNNEIQNQIGGQTTLVSIPSVDKIPLINTQQSTKTATFKFKRKPPLPNNYSKINRESFTKNDAAKQDSVGKNSYENYSFNQILADHIDPDKSFQNYLLKPFSDAYELEEKSQSLSPVRKVERPSSTKESINILHNKQDDNGKILADGNHQISRSLNQYSQYCEGSHHNSAKSEFEGNRSYQIESCISSTKGYSDDSKKYFSNGLALIKQKDGTNEINFNPLPNDFKPIGTRDIHSASSTRKLFNDKMTSSVTTPIKPNNLYQVTTIPESCAISTSSNTIYNLKGKIILSAESESKNSSILSGNSVPLTKKMVEALTKVDKSKNSFQVLKKTNFPFDFKVISKTQQQNLIGTNRFKISQKFNALKSYIFNDSVNFRKEDLDLKNKLNNSQMNQKKYAKRSECI